MIRRLVISIAITIVCIAALSDDGLTDNGKPADWLTDGGDPQRTAWQRDEKILTMANVKNMKLLWKIKLDNQPRQMHSLLPALIVGRVNTSGGPKQIVIVTGVSDNIYAIDADKGEIIWQKRFENTWTPAASGRGAYVLCPGGITAT